jgi:cytochrome c oxidase subunit 2
MTSFIIILVFLLILAILLMLFRIQALVSIVKGSNEKVGTSNQVNAFLMLVLPILGFILMAWYSMIASKEYLPEPASIHGKETDSLFWTTMYVITAMFIITNIALFWFSFKYQYKEGRKASYYHDNPTLEVVWTIIPAVIMAGLVFFGAMVWYRTLMVPPPSNAEEIEIMGKQFAWQVRYPGKDKKLGSYNFRLINDAEGNEFGINFDDKAANDDFVGTKMVIPVNHPVLLKIRARDVLHSVFAPHFRVKMDAVPGMPTQFHFTPTKTTAQMREETGNNKFNYEIACTEICGKGHFAMKLIVEVVEKEEYNKWYASQAPFLEQKPEFKNKGLKQLRQKNLALKAEK